MRPLTVIARTACNVFSWFMMVFGVYVIVHGDSSPGGGFQGGTMAATFLALILITQGGKRMLKWVKLAIYEGLELAGYLLFIGSGLIGIGAAFNRTMMYNFNAVPEKLLSVVNPWWPASGTIWLMNLGVGIEVTGAMSVLLIVMFRAIRMSEVKVDGHGKETGHDQR